MPGKSGRPRKAGPVKRAKASSGAKAVKASRASTARKTPKASKASRTANSSNATRSRSAGKAAKPATKTPSVLSTLADVYVSTRTEWRAWLATNHDRSAGIWLVFDRKSSRTDRFAYADSVEEALCFGWIDSLVRPIDADHYKQLFTPRKPKSVWSRTNKERVERLIAGGLMTPAGLARIDEAKRTGSWTALDAVEAQVIPPELEAALEADPKAKAHFFAFSPSARKAYLYWLNAAKRPETRATRVKEIVRLAAANRRVPG